jgi:hypothetical protein
VSDVCHGRIRRPKQVFGDREPKLGQVAHRGLSDEQAEARDECRSRQRGRSRQSGDGPRPLRALSHPREDDAHPRVGKRCGSRLPGRPAFAFDGHPHRIDQQ